MDIPDGVLVRRCREGEGTAFEEMVATYYRRIWNIAFRMIGDADNADDIAQEVFVRVYRSIRRFRRRSSFTTWLYRITVNLCTDFLRRHRRQAMLSLDQLEAENHRLTPDPVAAGQAAGTHNPSGNPLREVETTELRAELKEAILALPESYRLVIALRDIEGLSYREIASVLRCPEGTVMSRLFYAKRALREKLGRYVES
ncbi:MAG: sigma-70 family RNA polymerase sigma factor [Bacillota bacterium]